jgi:hypothetical protein
MKDMGKRFIFLFFKLLFLLICVIFFYKLNSVILQYEYKINFFFFEDTEIIKKVFIFFFNIYQVFKSNSYILFNFIFSNLIVVVNFLILFLILFFTYFFEFFFEILRFFFILILEIFLSFLCSFLFLFQSFLQVSYNIIYIYIYLYSLAILGCLKYNFIDILLVFLQNISFFQIKFYLFYVFIRFYINLNLYGFYIFIYIKVVLFQYFINYYFSFSIFKDIIYYNTLFYNIKMLFYIFFSLIKILSIFFLKFFFKISTYIIVLIVPLFIIKLVLIIVSKLFWFFITVVWLTINFFKFIFLFLLQIISNLDKFNSLDILYRSKKDLNSTKSEEYEEEYSLVDEMTDDEESTGSEDLGGKEMFGDQESGYEDMKAKRFKKNFYFSSFYFSRKSDKRGSVFEDMNNNLDERPFFNLNKFLWTQSRFFNRPFVFVSLVNYKRHKNYKILRNAKYYKDFCHFMNKSHKYGTTYSTDNFFFINTKLIKSRYKRFFSYIDGDTILNDLKKEDYNSNDMAYTYKKKVTEKLRDFYFMKKTYFQKYFFYHKLDNEDSFENISNKFHNNNNDSNSILSKFLYYFSNVRYLVLRITTLFMSLYMKFYLSLSDLNRIDLFYIGNIIYNQKVPFDIFHYYMTISICLLFFSFIGFFLLFYEDFMVHLLMFKDDVALLDFFASFFSKSRLSKRLQPELTKFFLIPFIKNPFLILSLIKSKKERITIAILIFCFFISIIFAIIVFF